MIKLPSFFCHPEKQTIDDRQNVTTAEPLTGPPGYSAGEVKVSGNLYQSCCIEFILTLKPRIEWPDPLPIRYVGKDLWTNSHPCYVNENLKG